MEINDYILAGISVLALVAGLWNAYTLARRAPSQNISDESSASANFHKIVIDLQSEVKETRRMLQNAHLDVSFRIKIGEQPTVTYWKWSSKDEESKTLPN